MQTYLKNGYIVTMGADETVYDGSFLIEDENIISVSISLGIPLILRLIIWFPESISGLKLRISSHFFYLYIVLFAFYGIMKIVFSSGGIHEIYI